MQPSKAPAASRSVLGTREVMSKLLEDWKVSRHCYVPIS